jgi:F0F1-type ATP synthase membrane subunit b/b'
MTLLESLTVVSLALGIIVVIGKYLIVLPLKNFIREQSYQIQPTANGGRSLADVARTVDRIEKQLDAHIALHLKDNN